MSLQIQRARSGLIGSVCCNCGKTFYSSPLCVGPLCDSRKRYFQRSDMIQNPANELAIRLSVARMNEAIKKPNVYKERLYEQH